MLKSTDFGSQRARGREADLHSHLGEGFSLDWAINYNRAKLWSVRFAATTDCYALRFILSYDGPNPVILRLQMILMVFWAMDLYHTTGMATFYFTQINCLGWEPTSISVN